MVVHVAQFRELVAHGRIWKVVQQLGSCWYIDWVVQCCYYKQAAAVLRHANLGGVHHRPRDVVAVLS